MAAFRPKVLIACDERVRDSYLPPTEIERLETFADWEWFSCEGGSIYTTNENPEAAAELSKHVGEINGSGCLPRLSHSYAGGFECCAKSQNHR